MPLDLPLIVVVAAVLLGGLGGAGVLLAVTARREARRALEVADTAVVGKEARELINEVQTFLNAVARTKAREGMAALRQARANGEKEPEAQQHTGGELSREQMRQLARTQGLM